MFCKEMRNSPERKLPTIWFYAAVAVSALLVAATALALLGLASGPAVATGVIFPRSAV